MLAANVQRQQGQNLSESLGAVKSYSYLQRLQRVRPLHVVVAMGVDGFAASEGRW